MKSGNVFTLCFFKIFFYYCRDVDAMVQRSQDSDGGHKCDDSKNGDFNGHDGVADSMKKKKCEFKDPQSDIVINELSKKQYTYESE